MTQHDYNIANQTFPSFRADLNSALEAIATINSGATPPSVTFANQLWADTSTGTLKQRNQTDTAWNTVRDLDSDGGLSTYAGNPNGNVNPEHIGQLLFNTADNLFYFAYGLTNTDWEQISSEKRISIQASAYTAKEFDDVILCNGAFTLTLFTAVNNAGKLITIRNLSGVDIVTIDGNAAETIDTLPSYQLDPNETVQLVSDGTNWVTLSTGSSGGGRTLISEVVINSTTPSIEFINLNNNYKFYELDLVDIRPELNDVTLHFRLSNDNGATYISTNDYEVAMHNTKSNGTGGILGGVGVTSFYPMSISNGGWRLSNGADKSLMSRIRLSGIGESTIVQTNWHTSYIESGVLNYVINSTGAGQLKMTTTVDALQFFFSNGGIEKGIFRLYGVN